MKDINSEGRLMIVTSRICPYCKYHSTDLESVEKCIQGHRFPIKVESSEYQKLSESDKQFGYPKEIKILMDDGKVITYQAKKRD